MSGNIFGDLANATKALNAHRFGVTTAGTNLANVNNPDYSRQSVILGERGTIDTLVGPRGLGVEVTGFKQYRDAVIDKEILRETSINSSLEAQYAALSKAEASIGQQINRGDDSAFVDGVSNSGSGGLAEVVNSFFNSFHSLSANPASSAEKEALIQQSQILVNKLNVTAERFVDLKADIGGQIETDVQQVNRLLGEIARLNSEVARAEASFAGQALDLRDQRQARLTELSKLIQVDVSNIDNSGGQVRVSVPTVSGTPPRIDLVDYAVAKRIEFNDTIPGVPMIELEGTTTALSVRGGGLHGSFQARDGAIQAYINNLNTFTGQLVTQVNTLYNTGVAPGTTNFFTSTGNASELTAAGISLDSTLNSTSLRTTNAVGQEQGDNSLVLSIAELAETKLAGLGNRTFGDHYRATVSDLAATVSSVDSRLKDEGIVFKLLKEQQDSVSGVNIDEEMTDMMKFQRAFEATGRLVRIIDEMLDVIINRMA